eukprot:909673-Prymnesium_polylepis.4
MQAKAHTFGHAFLITSRASLKRSFERVGRFGQKHAPPCAPFAPAATMGPPVLRAAAAAAFLPSRCFLFFAVLLALRVASSSAVAPPPPPPPPPPPLWLSPPVMSLLAATKRVNSMCEDMAATQRPMPGRSPPCRNAVSCCAQRASTRSSHSRHAYTDRRCACADGSMAFEILASEASSATVKTALLKAASASMMIFHALTSSSSEPSAAAAEPRMALSARMKGCRSALPVTSSAARTRAAAGAMNHRWVSSPSAKPTMASLMSSSSHLFSLPTAGGRCAWFLGAPGA